MDDLRDVPPLSHTEYLLDPEDEVDRAKLSQYHRESNAWLLFVRGLPSLTVISFR